MRQICVKTRRVIVALTSLLAPALAVLLPMHLHAQCTGPIQSSVQTITISSNGNTPTPLNFSQYNPPANYQMVSAVFSSFVTVNATIQMTNNSGSDMSLVKLSILDEDVFQINSNPLVDNSNNSLSDNIINKNNVYSGPILNGQTVTYGPATPWSNNNIFYDSVVQGDVGLPYFQGSGPVGLYYTSYPGISTLGGAPTVTPSFTITNNISLTYYYCYNGVLAADILSFTAVKNDDEVDLAWITANETPGRMYTVQTSYGNGTDFTDLTTLPAIGSGTEATYSHVYKIKPTDKGQLYFRLKMVDAGGAVAYSPMRIINLATGATSANFSIYPNPPTNFIQVSLPGQSGNWQIDILAADGNVVQRNSYFSTSLVQVNFNRKLAPGTYFVRAVNLLSGDQHTGSFVIRE